MKRFTSLLLAMLLILGLAACGEGGSVETSNPPSAVPTTASSAPDATNEPDNTPAGPDENGEYPTSLPLADEKVTFTMWGATPDAGSGMETANDSRARQELERRTNVHIEWDHPTIGEEVTKFNLMIASNLYPDAITGGPHYYTGGFDKFILDEVIIPLEDYSEYYPNYNIWRSKQELSLLSTVTDEGHIAALHQMRYPTQPMWQGPVIRTDLLDDIGYSGTVENIVTLEDWEEVLTLFRDYKDGFIPLVWQNGTEGFDPFVLAAFDLYAQAGFFQLDGVIHYTPYEAAFKDYLILCNDWYEKGLLDKEFYNRDATNFQAITLQGDVGISRAYKAVVDFFNSNTEGEGAHWEGISPPLRYEGQKFMAAHSYTSRLIYQGQAMTISSQCSEELIPIILGYTDYMFTEEGSLLCNYGIEGETFDYDASGNPILYDFITNNPDGYSFNQMMSQNLIHQASVFRYDWKRTETNISDQAKTIYQKWEANYADEITEMPNIAVAVDKAQDYANMFNEINSYAKEFAVKAISGTIDIEAEWDNHIRTLESMNVGEVIAMQQEALNGFYERDGSVGLN